MDWRTYRTLYRRRRARRPIESVLINQPDAPADGCRRNRHHRGGGRDRQRVLRRHGCAAAGDSLHAGARQGRARRARVTDRLECAARIARRSGTSKPQSALTLRATSARVHRGRIRPRTACAARPISRWPIPCAIARPSSVPRLPSDASCQPLDAIDVDRGEHAGAGRRIDQRRAERLVAGVRLPRSHQPDHQLAAPERLGAPAAARHRAREPGDLDVRRPQRLRRRVERPPQGRLRHVGVVVDAHAQRLPRHLGARSGTAATARPTTLTAISPRKPRISPSLRQQAWRHCRARP